MKLKLDENNYIIGYATIGDIEDSIEADVEIPADFEIGVYKYENNKLVKDISKADTRVQEELQNELRAQREPILKAFDIYKTNVQYGIDTETAEEHLIIIMWYQDLLDLKESAFINIPDKIKRYM
jgi:hypothetical protein